MRLMIRVIIGFLNWKISFVIKQTADSMLAAIESQNQTAKEVAGQVSQLLSLSDESVDITSKTQDDMLKLKDETNDVVEMITRFNKQQK